MIIALPETGHNHLADALVRDLGFTRTHVDAPLRELLLALDPFVDSGVTLANMGPSPRLSSKLEQVGGGTDEERWDRLLNPPRPGSAPDRIAAEVRRLLDVLRKQFHGGSDDADGDVVQVGFGVDWLEHALAITGRYDGDPEDVTHWITPAGVVGEQEAIVAYVKELRAPRPVRLGGYEVNMTQPPAPDVTFDPVANARVAAATLVKGDNEYIDPPPLVDEDVDLSTFTPEELAAGDALLDEMDAVVAAADPDTWQGKALKRARAARTVAENT